MDVRSIREAMNLTLKEFAEEMSVTLNAVQKWEKKQRWPRKKSLRKLVALERKLKNRA